VDVLITDDGLPESELAALRCPNMEIHRVKTPLQAVEEGL
jgi:hypothetical protein